MKGGGLLKKALGLLLVAFAFAVAPAASADTVAPAEGALSSTFAGEACAGGPCWMFFYKKGGGSGRVFSSPSGLDCTGNCYATLNFEDPNTPITLRAEVGPGSVLTRWEGCSPEPDGRSCTFLFYLSDTVCATFVRAGEPSPPAGCPPAGTSPPPPASPPPPPPSGPPPLGSRCTIPGSAQADVMRGTSGRDVICGNGGNDRIFGGGGHDLILGGAGNDKLYGQYGRDRIVAGSGADLLDGGGSDDSLSGGSSADVFFARDRIRDSLNGGSARDRARVDPVDRLSAIERRF